MKTARITALAVLLLLTGCSSIPEFTKEEFVKLPEGTQAAIIKHDYMTGFVLAAVLLAVCGFSFSITKKDKEDDDS